MHIGSCVTWFVVVVSRDKWRWLFKAAKHKVRERESEAYGAMENGHAVSCSLGCRVRLSCFELRVVST